MQLGGGYGLERFNTSATQRLVEELKFESPSADP